MANPDATVLAAGPTWIAGSTANGITIGGKTITHAITSGHDLLTWGYKWLNHEGGHMMGLVDLYPIPGTAQIYVGEYSLMALISGAAPEYFAWERWMLGWIDDDQVVLANPGTTTVALAPLETADGTKMIVVPIGPTTAIVVENRQPLGFDTALTKPGPLAYLVDTSIGTGSGVIQVLPLDQTDVRKLTATLGVGQTLTNKGLSMSCTASDANAATVVVTRS